MKTADAGRMLFYHRTDRDTAERITRQGFAADPADSYLLSLEPSVTLKDTVILCIALPAQAAHDVLNGFLPDRMDGLHEFVVPSDLLQTGYVSLIPAPEASHASR